MAKHQMPPPFEDHVDSETAAAERKALEELSDKIMRKARIQCLTSPEPADVFWGYIVLPMDCVPVWDKRIETMATDGRRIYYAPDFVAKLQPDEVYGTLIHEAFHKVSGHITRRLERQLEPWNVAADLAINGVLKKGGYKLPGCALFPGEPPFEKFPQDKSAEDYYDMLPRVKVGGGGKGKKKGQGPGEILPPKPEECHEIDQEIRVQVAAAAQAAKQRGTLPGDLARMVDAILETKTRWQDELAVFMDQVVQGHEEQSWKRVDTRMVASTGRYFPTTTTDSLRTVVLGVDTSGSIGEKELAEYNAEIEALLRDVKPQRVVIIWCDAAVHRVEEWSPNDGESSLDLSHAPGGGGTSHKPLFEEIEKRGLEPDVGVFLTDMYSDIESITPPGFPVIWCTKTKDHHAPFGRTVLIQFEQE